MTASDERLVLQADDAVLDREHGERVIAMYRAVLEAMAAGTRADRVHLPAGERDWLLAQGTAPAGPAGTTALHQIEEHAVRTPHAPAVVSLAARHESLRTRYAVVDGEPSTGERRTPPESRR